LIYTEDGQTAGYTTYDASKYLDTAFPNIYTLSKDQKPLAIDIQDIRGRLQAGEPEVVIPLVVSRESDKRYGSLGWELSANSTGMDIYLRNRSKGIQESWTEGESKSISFGAGESEVVDYELVFAFGTAGRQEISQRRQSGVGLEIYPNPVNSILEVRVTAPFRAVPYRIMGMDGQLVQQGEIRGKESQIDVRNLTAGLYILQVERESKTFIKEGN
jgi:hypothetical protein